MSKLTNVATEDSVDVEDTMAAETGSVTTAPEPRVLAVQRGLIVPPDVLRAALPEVASAVNDAIRSSTRVRHAPFYLQLELTEHAKKQRKPEYLPTCKKRTQFTLQQESMLSASPPREKINTPNMRQYERKSHCYTCKLQFLTKKDLDTHNEQQHQYKCDDCKIGYSTKEKLQEHKCPFCKICSKLFFPFDTYISHFKKFHHDLKFTCTACDEPFTNEDTLMVHQKSYVTFYIHCPKCDLNFNRFLCYECGDSYPNMNSFSSHSHGKSSKLKCSTCKAEFEHDLDLASHMRTHSYTVKRYTKVRKITEQTNDKVETEKKLDPENDKEENVNAKWFDSVRESFYKASKKESIKNLEDDWSADGIKQESEIEQTVTEVKNEIDLSLNNIQSNMLGSHLQMNEIKKEPNHWYEFNIGPTEIYLESDKQIQGQHRNIIMSDDSINCKSNNLDSIKMEPPDCNGEMEVFGALTSTGANVVKQEALEVSGDGDRQPCLELVKTE